MLAGCLIGLGAGTPRGAAARARLGEQANAPHGECRHGDRLAGGNSKPTGCERSRDITCVFYAHPEVARLEPIRRLAMP